MSALGGRELGMLHLKLQLPLCATSGAERLESWQEKAGREIAAASRPDP
jgi:hypothetical protein